MTRYALTVRYVLTVRCQCGQLIATGSEKTEVAYGGPLEMKVHPRSARLMAGKAQRYSYTLWKCCPGSPSMRIQWEEIP